MVANDIEARGIRDHAVLDAMSRVPRHLFVEPGYVKFAYSDSALPIEEDQTISQPYVVAMMTEAAQLDANDKVLEIGTGSGYQAAVLGEIVHEVFTIEIIEPLAQKAAQLLNQLEYTNIKVKHGDGYRGWDEAAPFDAILITAATPKIPRPLVDQLKIGGHLVMPLGSMSHTQDLVVLTKTKEGLERRLITGVVFVPMTGEVRKK
jgi:protein-L-isoaspartate(D-aspartate) O-methyltransferase